ncbi:hypothetical protein [Mesorhizobium sp. BR115XR7A]|uniref:hypothetical protein n=1 Tax=Mesorhizobium sp. BR115XR7A TaxID=2876645 RepID=UPI00398D0467
MLPRLEAAQREPITALAEMARDALPHGDVPTQSVSRSERLLRVVIRFEAQPL